MSRSAMAFAIGAFTLLSFSLVGIVRNDTYICLASSFIDCIRLCISMRLVSTLSLTRESFWAYALMLPDSSRVAHRVVMIA